MTTNSLVNNYLYEIENKVVNVHKCFINSDSYIVVISDEGDYHFVPLLEYITYVFNKNP